MARTKIKEVASSTIVDTINALHTTAVGITSVAVLDITKAWAAVGEALSKQKGKIPHGGWIPWVEANLKFGHKQAAKYMRVFENKETLLEEGGGSLNKALSRIATTSDIAPDRVSSERDSQIESLENELLDARKLIDELQEDDPEGEYQRMYTETLAELEALKRSGSESSDTLESDISSLKKLRESLRREVGGLSEISKLFARTREFFAREVALIPTLKIPPSVLRNTKGDAEALIVLMEDWTVAMRERYNV